jgi:hypothetical protein
MPRALFNGRHPLRRAPMIYVGYLPLNNALGTGPPPLLNRLASCLVVSVRGDIWVAVKEVGLVTFHPSSLCQGRRATPLPHIQYPSASNIQVPPLAWYEEPSPTIIFFMELGFQGFFLPPSSCRSYGGAGWDACCQNHFWLFPHGP